ncbi:MAG: glycosyltransferase family 1 protein [Magnetococcales bacterium]|nr:glycosyltransferase family 1 protein [Magnetococcales bacterium]MBF0114980.1 glycosyltransferase family 1 protein [Magnetococcales bacterium]
MDHQQLIQSLQKLDDENNMVGIFSTVANAGLKISEALLVINETLRQHRYRPAYIIALWLDTNRHSNIIISVAICFGAILYNKPEEFPRGLKKLRQQAEKLSRKEWTVLFDTIIHPSLSGIVETLHHQPVIEPIVQQLIDFCKEYIPLFRPMWDMETPPQPLELDSLRQLAKQRAQLIRYPLPQPGLARPTRRVVCFMKDFYILHRITHAMNAYGWQATAYGTADWGIHLQDDIRSVYHLGKEPPIDLLVVYTDQIIATPLQLKAFMLLIKQLRVINPQMKVVSVSCDAWGTRWGLSDGEPCCFRPDIYTILEQVDAIWSSDSPSLPLWQDPRFTDKIFHSHLPHAGYKGSTDRPFHPVMFYCGDKIFPEHWHRTFWLTAAEQFRLPITAQTHLHLSDGLPPLESYRGHLNRLEESTCCLHFNRKQTLATIVTHRSFEAPITGALLIQEFAPDMHRFFIPGEHYLEFNSMAELRAIAQFIQEEPEHADAMRKRGYAFAHQWYSDEKLIGYLDQRLWP